MNIDFRKIIYPLIIVVLQCILDNYADLGLYVRVVLIPYIILILPYRYKTISTMIIAFLIGLSVDIFTTGVMGLNAGAMTAVAFVRQKVLHSILDERNMERHDSPDLKVFGLTKGVLYLLFHYLIFFSAYTALDNFSFSPIGFYTAKILFSTVVSSVISILLFGKQKKN